MCTFKHALHQVELIHTIERVSNGERQLTYVGVKKRFSGHGRNHRHCLPGLERLEPCRLLFQRRNHTNLGHEHSRVRTCHPCGRRD